MTGASSSPARLLLSLGDLVVSRFFPPDRAAGWVALRLVTWVGEGCYEILVQQRGWWDRFFYKEEDVAKHLADGEWERVA